LEHQLRGVTAAWAGKNWHQRRRNRQARFTSDAHQRGTAQADLLRQRGPPHALVAACADVAGQFLPEFGRDSHAGTSRAGEVERLLEFGDGHGGP
jgi:hypothetical protein